MLQYKEIKALLSLLDDQDPEVLDHIETHILAMGEGIIPFLEKELEIADNVMVQEKINELIHSLQFEATKQKLLEWKQTHQQDLLFGMWAIATYQYPELNLETIRQEIEQIYYKVWLNFREKLHPHDQIKLINYVLFEQYRFAPNIKQFHAPTNNMINKVLENKKGNPISLCVIYLLIAQRFKLPIFGVNLPNLFMLIYQGDNHSFYINAFNKGLIFSRKDIENYIAQLNLTHSDTFYMPCTHVDIVRRVLRNLVIAFENQGETQKMNEVQELVDILGN